MAACFGVHIKPTDNCRSLSYCFCIQCNCSVSHIGHIEGGHGKASLEMIIIVANKLNVTVDQLLCDCYEDPTAVYLREIAKRIEQYDVSQRILVCESLENYLDTLERFANK